MLDFFYASVWVLVGVTVFGAVHSATIGIGNILHWLFAAFLSIIIGAIIVLVVMTVKQFIWGRHG